MADAESKEGDFSSWPLVTVGIPTCNRASTFSLALESVLAQTYPNIEIVISDNASSDETPNIARAYASADPRIRYIRQPHNRGPTANFFEVLRHANGEFFLWLGDDDWLDRNYIAACVGLLCENAQLVLVAGKTIAYKDEVKVGVGRSISLRSASSLRRVLSFYANVGDNGTFYGAYRRRCLVESKLRNTMGWDWLLVASMAFLGKIETIDGTFRHRRLGGASQSIKRIGEVANLPRIQTVFPNISIALAAFDDIVLRNPIYSRMPLPGRVMLGVLTLTGILYWKGLIQNLKTAVVRGGIGFFGEQRYRAFLNRLRRKRTFE